jgi:hypothetical protein
VDKRFPGENYSHYVCRTGFSDTMTARAFKQQFTECRLATDKEVALDNILKKCSGLTQEKEESERECDKYSNGYAYGPCFGSDEPQ